MNIGNYLKVALISLIMMNANAFEFEVTNKSSKIIEVNCSFANIASAGMWHENIDPGKNSQKLIPSDLNYHNKVRCYIMDPLINKTKCWYQVTTGSLSLTFELKEGFNLCHPQGTQSVNKKSGAISISVY